MTPTVGVGAFVFDAEGRVLVIERGHPPGEGLWSVPGGRLEFGETLAQAVAREVREETGLIAEVGPLVCVIESVGLASDAERRGESIESVGLADARSDAERRGESIAPSGDDHHYVILDYLARDVGGWLAPGGDARA
ncbi:MAG TPA: NUDIX domain-containing protein, partial [Kofleriaceae bacterium]|nr:NUDIX domain-containing protein [Kofleriaceae bacterium]